jgi:hypothetical protein
LDNTPQQRTDVVKDLGLSFEGTDSVKPSVATAPIRRMAISGPPKSSVMVAPSMQASEDEGLRPKSFFN